MATRDTIEKAVELKLQFEKMCPDEAFRIVDQSTARYSQFAVLSVRHCPECGAEVLSAAVGECGRDLCGPCQAREEASAKDRHLRRQEVLAEEAERWRVWDEELN